MSLDVTTVGTWSYTVPDSSMIVEIHVARCHYGRRLEVYCAGEQCRSYAENNKRTSYATTSKIQTYLGYIDCCPNHQRQVLVERAVRVGHTIVLKQCRPWVDALHVDLGQSDLVGVCLHNATDSVDEQLAVLELAKPDGAPESAKVGTLRDTRLWIVRNGSLKYSMTVRGVI